jgi:hypothetical protein
MTSPEMISMMEGLADGMLQRLPAGYGKSVYPKGQSRANVSVYTETASAAKDNAKNNSLLKAMGGGI